MQKHHVLRSKSEIYAILYAGARVKGGTRLPTNEKFYSGPDKPATSYSLYYIGLCDSDEFRLEGVPSAATVSRSTNGESVADYSDSIIRFNDSRKSTFKRVSGFGAMPSKRVRASHRFDLFYDERGVEQMRMESGFDPCSWVSPEADLECLPVLAILTRFIQLKEAEFTHSYAGGGPDAV